MDPATNDLRDVFTSLYRLVCDERDADAAFALWAADADIALYGSEEGDTGVGPEAVRAHLITIAASESDIAFAWDEQRVHVEGEAAWVTASGTLSANGRGSAYQVIGVFVRRDGRWLWHTHSGSEPRPSP